MIKWHNFNPRAEISAQVAGTGLKFQPRGCTQPCGLKIPHVIIHTTQQGFIVKAGLKFQLSQQG